MDIYRKEYSLKFDGAEVKNHEMSLDLFVSQLDNIVKIVNETQKKILTKEQHAELKIKSEIKPGSIDISLLFELTGKILPVAPDLIKIMIEIINFKKFLKGEKPKKVSPNSDGTMKIMNCNNEYQNVNGNVYNISINNSVINSSLDRLTTPLQNGKLNRISVTEKAENEKLPVSLERAEILHSDIKSLQFNTVDVPDVIEEENKIVEVLTANIDGNKKKWRFNDVEENVEFVANIEDEEFLNKITNKEISFNNGTILNVVLRTITNPNKKRFNKQREIINAELEE